MRKSRKFWQRGSNSNQRGIFQSLFGTCEEGVCFITENLDRDSNIHIWKEIRLCFEMV